MYADGTSIYHCSKDMPQLNREINEDLEKLDEWLMGNKLSLNVAFVLFCFVNLFYIDLCT